MSKKTGKTEFDFTKIKTFADACVKCGTTEEAFNKKWIDKGFDLDTICYEKLKIVYRAINNERKPDWSKSENKFWAWHWVLSSGVAFVISDFGYSGTYSILGSRLCTFSAEQQLHINKYFEDLWIGFKL